MSPQRARAAKYLAAVSVLLVALTATQPSAQTPRAAEREVVEPGWFMFFVTDLDRSIAFYHDTIGLKVTRDLSKGVDWQTTPLVLRVHNTIGGSYRPTTHLFPGEPDSTGLELLQYKDIGRDPVRARVQDVGAGTVILVVRDVDALTNELKAKGARVITSGGAPMMTKSGGTRNRGVLLSDPDGLFLELRQADPAAAASDQASRHVIGARVCLTVGDAEKVASFFRDVFGFEGTVTPFAPDDGLMGFGGRVQLRRAALHIPGNPLVVELLEFKGVERKNVRSPEALQDGVYVMPGVATLKLNVRDMQSIVRKVQMAGARVVSAGGQPIERISDLHTQAVIKDPNDLFIYFSQRFAAQAAAGAPR